jgi:long-chain acyl-CoA synthetase
MDVSRFLTLQPGPQLLRDRAGERADRVRFWTRAGDGWSPTTWRKLHSDVAAATGGLVALGLMPGERAAIFAPNRVAWLEAAYAIQAAGAAVVPIYPASTADQARYVLGHAAVRVVFVGSAGLLAKLAAVRTELTQMQHVVVFDAALAPAAVDAFGAERVHTWDALLALGTGTAGDTYDARVDALRLEDVGLVLYTSGTSGPPKGVPLTYRNTAVNGRDWLTNNAALVEEGDVDLLWLPMSHIFGFGEAGLGNVLGFETYLVEPAEVLTQMQQLRPHVFMSVPSLWDKLATQADGDVARLQALTGGRLRFCLSGGAGLPRDVKERFREAGLLIIEGYGLTEASPTLTMNRPERVRFDSVGLPFPSVAVRLAEDGEIQARGASIFGGYLGDPEATAAAFTEDGWLRTGDLGRFTEDGFLQIIGRKKEILVTAGGKNVPPANIESGFAGDPLIAHVMVYGDGRKYLVAGIWPDEGAVARLADERDLDLAAAREAAVRAISALVESVNATLARYETIKRFRVFFDAPLSVEAGQLTSTLKLRRTQIGEAFGASLDALYLEDEA